MNSTRKIKLFCWPYAGGSASSYLSWKNYLSANIEVIPVQLAGRGERFGDKGYHSFHEMCQEGFEFLLKNINDEEKYVLFGHSMGSWIVYEVCKRLKNTQYEKNLQTVIFSANRAPFSRSNEKKIHHLPTSDFITEVMKLGGGDRKILENKDFGEIFVQILRNDYQLIENYTCKKNDLNLNCNINIFNGLKDNITPMGLLAWNECTTCKFKIYNFRGGHFFINEDMSNVIRIIENIINEGEI